MRTVLEHYWREFPKPASQATRSSLTLAFFKKIVFANLNILKLIVF